MKILIVGSSGYVGSYLSKRFKAEGVAVQGCDQRAGGETTLVCHSSEIVKTVLAKFDVILYFAGVSSVRAALESPYLAITENVSTLTEFVSRLGENQVLVYASSGSVYSDLQQIVGPHNVRKSRESDPLSFPSNPYDASKIAGDYSLMFQGSKAQVVGLRMGTVSGFNLQRESFRQELVFNAMNLSALRESEIRLRNPNSWRAILFLDDLFELVRAIVFSERKLPPILNALSFNVTMSQLAQEVSKHHEVPIRLLPDSRTYSFALDEDLASNFFSPGNSTIGERCEQLKLELLEGGWL
jgi:nucleoside-diphosphate-sugar epimerase